MDSPRDSFPGQSWMHDCEFLSALSQGTSRNVHPKQHVRFQKTNQCTDHDRSALPLGDSMPSS